MSDERSNKNQVFNGEAPVNSPKVEEAAPAVPPAAPQTIQNEMGIDIPVTAVPLPSSGLVYPEGHPLCGQTTVQVRAMTTREEDILMSPALIKDGTVIDELIKSVLVTPGVDVKTLLSGDRNALMVAIRAIGYGPEYSGNVKCEHCSATTERAFDLNALPIKRLTLEPVNPHQNAFKFTLPLSGKEVHFKFMTGQDETNIKLTNTAKKKAYNNTKRDNLVTTQLSQAILYVEGIDKSKLNPFIQSMPARDARALREFIKKNEPGIEMKANSDCQSCGEVSEVAIPIGPKFLWPAAD